jgi:hypothetical protein
VQALRRSDVVTAIKDLSPADLAALGWPDLTPEHLAELEEYLASFFAEHPVATVGFKLTPDEVVA